MESNDSKQLVLHTEVLPKETEKALKFLSSQTWLTQGGWYLAGGTALALQIFIPKQKYITYGTILI